MGRGSGRSTLRDDPDFDAAPDGWVKWVVVVHGLMLSCTALVWLIAILEVISGHLAIGASGPEWWALGIVSISGLFLVLPIWRRVLRPRNTSRKLRRRFLRLASANTIAVIGLGILLFLARAGDTDIDLPQAWADEVAILRELDVLTASILLGLVLVLLLAALLLGRAAYLSFSFAGGPSPRFGVTAVVAALAMVVGWGLLVGTGSALRIGLEWALKLLGTLVPGPWILEELQPRPGFMVHPSTLDNDTMSLANGILVINTASDLVFLGVIVAIGVLAHVVSLRNGQPDDETEPGRWWRLLHFIVGHLHFLLPIALIAAIVAWLTLIVGVWPEIEQAATGAQTDSFKALLPRWLSLASLAIALVAFGFAVSRGTWKLIRVPVDTLADVVGFFPTQWHPLGGLSYREIVIHELNTATLEIEEPVIYSGHSQGSVIGMWFLLYVHPHPERVGLVTSGSPIRSLYAAFFPRFFNDDTIAATLQRVHSWTNVWRGTDPIATELTLPPSDPQDAAPDPSGPPKEIKNEKSIDPPCLDTSFPEEDEPENPQKARWHLNYWTDYKLRNIVENVATRLRESSPEGGGGQQ